MHLSILKCGLNVDFPQDVVDITAYDPYDIRRQMRKSLDQGKRQTMNLSFFALPSLPRPLSQGYLIYLHTV